MSTCLAVLDDGPVGQGFVVVPVAGGGSDFDLQTSWSPAVRNAFFASGADGLVANYARGFIGHDLEFVRGLPLRRLSVLARTIADLSPIYSLSGTLADLRVQTGSGTRISRPSMLEID